MKRLLAAMILGIVLTSAQSCSYMRNRGADAKDMIDIGFTFSKSPQFAAYYDFVPIIPIGYGKVEGRFTGLGGGEFAGWAPHYEKSYGAILWGQEELNFGTPKDKLAAMTDSDRQKAMDFQRTGVIGAVQGPFPGPHYLISCPHYVHLGWFGVVATPRYLQMLDFLVGWTTLDICGDDNRGK